MEEELLNKYWSVVKTELDKFRPGPNEDCHYYPCHFRGQDCAYCYCPFYPCMDSRLGKMVKKEDGGEVWSCQDCFWTHRKDVAKLISENFPSSETVPSDEFRQEIKDRIEKKCAVRAKPIMILGATSGAGKSLITSAFCRIFSDMNYNVAPFKSQNMSLNSMATPDGEMARAQYLQSLAARTDPEAAMNPILLKPQGDDISQVMVNGSVYKTMSVQEYYDDFTVGEGVDIVTQAWEYLARTRDIVVIEGAGSPAEINLTERELSNMKAAEIAGAPCILVVNMLRGGAFAYAFGTVMLLPPERRSMVKGIIFNNFHGSNPECLEKGIKQLECLLDIPVLGVLPHLEHALPEEDSQDLKSSEDGSEVAIVHLPRISNFTDFDALTLSGVSVKFVRQPQDLKKARAIVIPGTKNTFADMNWMKENGFFEALQELKGKVPILGICGGYQILGKSIYDTEGIEGEIKAAEGLGFLDVSTVFDTNDKKTVQVTGRLENGEEVRGYEIHMGKTESREKPLLTMDDGSSEGSVSPDGMVIGTYMHGIFDLPPFRNFFLDKASLQGEEDIDYDAEVDKELDRLAEMVRSNVDMEKIMKILEDGL